MDSITSRGSLASAAGSVLSDKSPLLTTSEAAEYLRLRPSALEQDRVFGRLGLPYYRLGRQIRYHQRDLDAWLDGRRRLAPTQAAE